MRRACAGLFAVLLTVAACAASQPAASQPAASQPAAPGAPPIAFTAVALPDGAVPETITAAGGLLLVGVHRAGAAQQPGLVLRGTDGAFTEVPAQAATGYGRTASWFSLAADGHRVLGIGGDRGGAHGNVRWSVWTGSTTGVAEHVQAFTTFGGWGAGDLVDAVLTPGGMTVVGSWQSDSTQDGAGLDVAVWTPNGDDWVRRSSAGTALRSTRAALEFATAATSLGSDVLVAGWQLATGAGGGQQPVVWTSRPGKTTWTKTVLPDAGRAGSAKAVRCAGSACAVVGVVDGLLALWRLADGRWSRVAGLPPITVGDHDRVAAPLDPGGDPVIVAADRGQVSIVTVAGSVVSVRPAAGPSVPVLAAAEVGPSTYVLSGDPTSPALWRAGAG